MQGHKQIIAARKQGFKPKAIFIEVGLTQPIFRFPFQDPEKALAYNDLPTVFIHESEMQSRHDLRFVAGCRVHVMGKAINDDLLAIGEAVANAGANHIILSGLKDPELMEFKEGEWHASTTA